MNDNHEKPGAGHERGLPERMIVWLLVILRNILKG